MVKPDSAAWLTNSFGVEKKGQKPVKTSEIAMCRCSETLVAEADEKKSC